MTKRDEASAPGAAGGLARRSVVVACGLSVGLALVALMTRGASFRHDLAPNRLSHDSGAAYIAAMDTSWLIEPKGFAYVWTDLDQLSDAHYFDYNHMNSQGIAKYTPMLAAKLAETMRAKGWEAR